MIKIIHGNKVTHKYISQALELDRISYGDIYQLQLDSCFSFFEANSEIYIMAINDTTDTVIGYINFSPITDNMFNLLSSGQVVDTVIVSDDIVQYIKDQDCWGYFSSIVVHPDYRQHGIATQMLLCWKELVFDLAKNRNIFFKGIVADAVSDVGYHILSEIGFVYSKVSSHDSQVMVLNLFSDKVVPSKFNDNLLGIYRKNGEKDYAVQV